MKKFLLYFLLSFFAITLIFTCLYFTILAVNNFTNIKILHQENVVNDNQEKDSIINDLKEENLIYKSIIEELEEKISNIENSSEELQLIQISENKYLFFNNYGEIVSNQEVFLYNKSDLKISKVLMQFEISDIGVYSEIEVIELESGYVVLTFKSEYGNIVSVFVYSILDNAMYPMGGAEYTATVFKLDESCIFIGCKPGVSEPSTVLNLPKTLNGDSSSNINYSFYPGKAIYSSTGLVFMTCGDYPFVTCDPSCCPYLYLWDSELSEFVKLTDVGHYWTIVEETSETITFEGLTVDTNETVQIIYNITEKTITDNKGNV